MIKEMLDILSYIKHMITLSYEARNIFTLKKKDLDEEDKDQLKNSVKNFRDKHPRISNNLFWIKGKIDDFLSFTTSSMFIRIVNIIFVLSMLAVIPFPLGIISVALVVTASVVATVFEINKHHNLKKLEMSHAFVKQVHGQELHQDIALEEGRKEVIKALEPSKSLIKSVAKAVRDSLLEKFVFVAVHIFTLNFIAAGLNIFAGIIGMKAEIFNRRKADNYKYELRCNIDKIVTNMAIKKIQEREDWKEKKDDDFKKLLEDTKKEIRTAMEVRFQYAKENKQYEINSEKSEYKTFGKVIFKNIGDLQTLDTKTTKSSTWKSFIITLGEISSSAKSTIKEKFNNPAPKTIIDTVLQEVAQDRDVNAENNIEVTQLDTSTQQPSYVLRNRMREQKGQEQTASK